MLEMLGFKYGYIGFSGISRCRTVDGACFRLRQFFPDYIFSDVTIEGMATTLPEVKTILDGITHGGSRISDEVEVRNLKESLELLVELVMTSSFKVDKETFCKLHARAAQEEALVWGAFRTGGVSLAGTAYKPPAAEMLPVTFEKGIQFINTISNPLEKGIVFFLFGAFRQFFFDGNKRTSRLMMNGILMSNGYDAIMIPAKSKHEFNRLMVEFYDTKTADNIMRFMLKCYKLNSANIS